MFEELTNPGTSAPGMAQTTRVRTYGLPVVMTVGEAAEFLGVNAKTLYDAIRAGGVPARRIGRRVVILRDSLVSWLKSQEHVLPSRKRRS